MCLDSALPNTLPVLDILRTRQRAKCLGRTVVQAREKEYLEGLCLARRLNQKVHLGRQTKVFIEYNQSPGIVFDIDIVTVPL